VRDTQHLLGLLADQEITQPQKIGVSGISYGGGQSVMLAYLRDRIRTRNSSFAPWTSPDGTPMQIAAAFPRWPWSDLVSSLLPNGRFLDFDPATIGPEPRSHRDLAQELHRRAVRLGPRQRHLLRRAPAGRRRAPGASAPEPVLR